MAPFRRFVAEAPVYICVLLFEPLAPWVLGGRGRGDVALRDVCAPTQGVWQPSWLCVL